VKIFRSSKAHGSHQYQPELATALNAYSRSLGDNSRLKEALEAAEEAVNIRRTLAGERPEIYTQPLVISLRDVFNLHRQRGNHRDACSTAEEVADIYRNLIHDGFKDFKSDLASLLMATSNSSLELNRNARALTLIKEAVRLYAQLASSAADKHKPLHAESLDIAHSCYTRLGRDRDAYQVACEAIEIRENLGYEQSERDSKFFASSITNAAKSLLKLNALQMLAKNSHRRYQFIPNSSAITVKNINRSLLFYGAIYRVALANSAVTTRPWKRQNKQSRYIEK